MHGRRCQRSFPLNDVKPGMKGEVYTIFSGDQVEKVDLEVIGILHNALGPKEDVILVQLLGDKAEQTGVAAGMSGSPVYFDGKLAGALSLKLGVFTKEAIGGVTPIEDMLDVEKDSPALPVRLGAAHAAIAARRANCGLCGAGVRRCAPQFSRRTAAPDAGAENFWFPSRRR